MSDTWQLVRAAIATKLNASAGCTAAGLRSATIRTEEKLAPPAIKVMEPGFTWGGGTQQMDQYTLIIPAELIVPRPAGRERGSPVAAAIARAVQVEFRVAFNMGLESLGVYSAQLVGWEPDLDEYRDTDLIGGRLTFQVDLWETISRTSA